MFKINLKIKGSMRESDMPINMVSTNGKTVITYNDHHVMQNKLYLNNAE